MQTSTARGLSATDDDEAKKFHQRRQPDLPEDDDVESRRKGVEGRRSTADRQTEGACDKTIRLRRSLVGRKEWQMRSGHYDERGEREAKVQCICKDDSRIVKIRRCSAW